MDLLHQINGIKQIGFARAGRAAAHIHTGHGSPPAKDHRTSGETFFILGMTNFNTAHIGDGACPSHGL
jgi:hypothetical protein